MIGIAQSASNRSANAVWVRAHPWFKSPSLRSLPLLARGYSPRWRKRTADTARPTRPGVRASAIARAGHGDPLTKAARLLADEPDMTGADLGRALGISRAREATALCVILSTLKKS
jgi:hypothetical protein